MADDAPVSQVAVVPRAGTQARRRDHLGGGDSRVMPQVDAFADRPVIAEAARATSRPPRRDRLIDQVDQGLQLDPIDGHGWYTEPGGPVKNREQRERGRDGAM